MAQQGLLSPSVLKRVCDNMCSRSIFFRAIVRIGFEKHRSCSCIIQSRSIWSWFGNFQFINCPMCSENLETNEQNCSEKDRNDPDADVHSCPLNLWARSIGSGWWLNKTSLSLLRKILQDIPTANQSMLYVVVILTHQSLINLAAPFSSNQCSSLHWYFALMA